MAMLTTRSVAANADDDDDDWDEDEIEALVFAVCALSSVVPMARHGYTLHPVPRSHAPRTLCFSSHGLLPMAHCSWPA